MDFGGTLKYAFILAVPLFLALFAQAELKRIIVDLDYKMVKGPSHSKTLSPGATQKQKKVEVYMPDFSTESKNTVQDVTCLTHTGSKLTVSPKRQSVFIDTASGDRLNYMIVTTLGSGSTKNKLESKYLLDDGRKIVMTFIDESSDGQGYYVRQSGDTSPAFACSRIE